MAFYQMLLNIKDTNPNSKNLADKIKIISNFKGVNFNIILYLFIDYRMLMFRSQFVYK